MSAKHKEAVRALHGLFDIRELVPRSLYESFAADTLWGLFDTELLLGLAWVRLRFGKSITINNWHKGGKREYSGFRPSGCTVGATLSGHRLGKCVDMIAGDLERLRALCLECPHFTELEDERDTPSWVHASTRAHMMEGLRIVRA